MKKRDRTVLKLEKRDRTMLELEKRDRTMLELKRKRAILGGRQKSTKFTQEKNSTDEL